MDERSNSSNQKKEDASGDKQEGSTQKITNFFPLLKTEGRAKMCALKSGDSKQKEMLRKMKGKESMTLRSKRQDKLNEKSNNGSTSSQSKEKVRNMSVASALKTPLSQVLRKSIEATDKKEGVDKSNQMKISESTAKSQNAESKKNLSDGESGRMLRQKTVAPEKPVKSTGPYKRKTESNQTSTGNEKVKPEGPVHRGRAAKVTYAADTVIEEGKSDSASLNSNSGNKVRKYRKRHFRGSTYGLYLTPARKKKKKMKSSQDESKDDECSVTSTENNSFLDSEDGNSLVSEDFFTPSEKSLVDEEHGLESQSSSVLSTEKKYEKKELISSVETEELNSNAQTTEEKKPEVKIEISADYEENTQNVTDLFQDLEEMQWESDQKANEVDSTNASQNNKLPQYDDISSESFTNALHFSFKKNSEDSEENFMKEGLTMSENPEGSTMIDSSNNCDAVEKSSDKIDLPETSETCLSINNISEIFDLKDDSNVDIKDDSNVDMKDDSNVDLKDDSNVDIKDDSNLASSVSSENKADLSLMTSAISEIKSDLNLESADMLSNKDSLNLLFEDVNDSKDDLNLMSSAITGNKEMDLDSSNLPEKPNFNLSSEVFNESRENSNQMSYDVVEKVSAVSPLGVPESEDINNSDSLLTNEIKQDSNSLPFTNENKQDSNSLTFTTENKPDSDSITFTNENSKHDSNSVTFSDKDKQNSNSETFTNEVKQNSNSSPPFTNEKEITEPLEFKGIERNKTVFSSVADEIAEEDLKKDDDHFDADQNKENNHFDSHMEVDNVDKDDDDDDDDQSTIATCVKSRQRIKRRFTDDIVDTDLGILSVAAMNAASVKKVMLKPEAPKDFIENFQSVTRTEAKKSGTAAKIECVFNYKQSPIKSCTCEVDSFEAKMENNSEGNFCQAVDGIDDKLLGCTNPVVTSRLVRPSVKLPFSIMCETHLWRLKHHHACPYCGLFCSQGSFMQCSGEGLQSIHLFHEQCQNREDGTVPFCFHCGSSSSLKRVHLELHMASPPSFFLNQASKMSVPDVSKARISFSESSDFYKKEEDETSLTFKIEDSGKILSSAGLPNDSSKEELDKLISMLNDEKIQSYTLTPDEFYDTAASGDVLKVLYMLVKGFDPNEKFASHEGETSLHAAAANGHATIVHLLIQAGAVNDSLNEKMYTPLMLAVENGHREVVHYLVKKGAITDFKGENGMSSLHLAAKSGNLDVLKILMSSRDTDIDAQDDGGWTPIVWASEHGHLNVVKYLLKRGANPNIRDNEGNIGLHWSAFSGSVEISYLYLDYGCDINTVNELGDTPLHIAARQDSFPCVTLFLSRGADVTILNKAEKLPAECCIDKNSDTYLSLSLNMLLKKITKKYQHKAEKIIHRDISRGKEQIAIQCVNAFDDEMPPLDFLYVTENCETMPIKIDRTITSLQSCHCEDDCSTASCSCASISYQCWYDKEGLLLPEFNLLDPPMLFECNRACSCWSLNCHNRVLQNGITSRLQLIRTKGKGWGVRTLKDIPRGAFICEYVGELISDSAADKRADDSYLFDLDNRDGETYCLDARYYGNISRFINHLCDPNLVPVKIYVDHQDLNFPRIAFFSSRDIKQYEELGFDYGEKFWAIKYKSFTCECGTPKCKYSKDNIHITMASYYRRLKEEQMEEAAAQQQVEVPIT